MYEIVVWNGDCSILGNHSVIHLSYVTGYIYMNKNIQILTLIQTIL